MKTIYLKGKAVSYIQKKSDRKTISASVDKSGAIEVRTPRSVSDTYVREFLSANADKLLKMLDRAEARMEYEADLDGGEAARLRALAEEIIPGRVAHYSRIMGLSPNSVNINGARTRFGSCSSKGNLNFSYRVMAYSAKAVDYVVIHELAHLVHMDHSRAFWQTVGRYMPDYAVARAELKRIPGYDLQE